MPLINILIFRGTGGVRDKTSVHYAKKALIRAGHVGVAGVIDGEIIGFHPTPKIAEELDEEELIEKLANYEAIDGCLQDDTKYFKEAYQLANEEKLRTTVYMYSVEISQKTLNAIQTWYRNNIVKPYNFPKRGKFTGNDTNCATFWITWFDDENLKLPVNTGSIEELTDFMKEKGFPQWQPTNASS